MDAGIPLAASDQTIDLQQQVFRLQALLEASRQVHSTIREQEVLDSVLRIAVRELEMSGASFPAAGLNYGELPTAADERPAYPLADRDGRTMEVLQVSPPEGRELTIYEADFLEGLALQAAVALENARNHKRNLEYARLERDLSAARDIQRSLLPQRLPEIGGYSLGFRSDTCYEVGGDYFDLVEPGDGSVIMAVCDVAGKGLASAIMATGFRAAFRAMASTGMPLAELAGRINQHHWGEGEEARRKYVTAIIVRLYPEAGEVEIVNAGHNSGFLVQAGEKPKLIDSSGTPLGLLPGMSYSSERHPFPPGSRLLFYTDGLTEVFQGDEEFGPERLMESFLRCPEQNADGILTALWAELAEFSAGGPQGDDMTALALCRGTAATELPS